jgi:hypothetical protein
MQTPDNNYQYWNELDRVRTPGNTIAQDSPVDAEHLAQVVNRLTEKLQAANTQIELLRAQVSQSSQAKSKSEVRDKRIIDRLAHSVSDQAVIIRLQQKELEEQRKQISTLLSDGKVWTGADGSRWQAVWYDGLDGEV